MTSIFPAHPECRWCGNLHPVEEMRDLTQGVHSVRLSDQWRPKA